MKNKNDKIFNSAVGHNNPPTPFQVVGSGAKQFLKSTAKVAGNIIAKPFDKAIKVAKMKDAEIERKRKSGELLY